MKLIQIGTPAHNLPSLPWFGWRPVAWVSRAHSRPVEDCPARPAGCEHPTTESLIMKQAELRTCFLVLRRDAGSPRREEPEDLAASQAQHGACHSEGMVNRKL